MLVFNRDINNTEHGHPKAIGAEERRTERLALSGTDITILSITHVYCALEATKYVLMQPLRFRNAKTWVQ